MSTERPEDRWHTEEKDDPPFWRAVRGLLDEGLHTRRGLSADEYVSLCRQAWDECEVSPSFPFKVLRDPLSKPEGILANSSYDYLHWRAADVLESTPDPSNEIRCVALGPVNPDLSTGPDANEKPPAEEPEVPETRRYILAVFDVLGFSALLEEKGLDEIISLYAKLISESVLKDSMNSWNLARLNDTEQASIWGPTPIRHAHFSDTVFLWAPLVQHFIAPFMARCADLVCEALSMGLPLRGALSAGPAVMHSRSGTFVGSPVIEAAKLEQAQNWVGVTLGLSMLAADVSREFDPNLVIPYPVPLKKGKIGVPSNLALDWPRRFNTSYGTSPEKALETLDQSPKHHVYYANARKFADFSSGPLFRSEGLHPPDLGDLVQAAANAHSGNVKGSI